MYNLLNEEALTLGQRFKHFREQKGLSQTSLAEGICSYSTISHLENDRSIPSPKIMGKLAERLGVPLSDIMMKEETELDIDFQVDMLRVYTEMGDYHHALKLADELSKRDVLLHHTRVIHICRAECYIRVREFQDAVDLLLPFLEQQEIQQDIDDELLCDAYNKLGTAYFRLRDFEKAFAAYYSGYRISLKLASFGLVAARVTKNLGLTCNQLLLTEDAELYLEKSFRYYESVADTKGLADIFFALAMSTNDSAYLIKSLALYESMNMIHEANVVRQDYAFEVESKIDFRSALQKIESTVVFFEGCGDYGMCVYSLSKAIMLCLDNKLQEEASQYLVRAESIKDREHVESEYYTADFYRARAMYNMSQRNYEQCILDSEKSSELCDKMGLYGESSISLQLAAEAYHQMGDGGSAYLVSKRVIELLRHKKGGK